MNLTNPKIDGTQNTVENILKAIPRTNPASYSVSGTISISPWAEVSGLNPIGGIIDSIEWHYQGIAPYNGTDGGSTIANGVISASSTEGYFSVFSQASGQSPVVQSVVIPNSDYYHCAGIQLLGDLLAASLESEDDGDNGLIAFYDVSNPASPKYLYSLTMPATKASTAAITNYTDSNGVEQCLLMVYQYDNYEMYIYRAPASAVGTGPASVWTRSETYNGSAFDTGDQYQCFSLVTQSGSGDDQVFLLGFREDEEVWLYSINTSNAINSGYGLPALVAKYTGWNGSDFRNGTGLQIVDSTTLRIFGTATDPSGETDDYTFNIYVYG